ncbi:MAG: PASTA domain-containing protein, partial [Deltaproteobacteria bacterium]|nr:PASTA domain-containing protein [Deltaproteobacteria bacterium]
VMDPHTGEVLAMASMPTFDPNELKDSGPGQRKNKAITDSFEPGSIFKLFLVSAGIEENAVKTTDAIYCENGSYMVADRVFHDTKKHGWLTVPQIIKYSSNIGSAKIGERLGKARLYRYLKSFGFGDKTGIDLPGEAAGSFRNPSDWSEVTLHTVSFGHGVSTTGIQLITALSSIANRGFLMKPYVVKALRDSKGGAVSEAHPVIVRRVISEATAKKMTDMLIGVTRDEGTGVKAAIDGFDAAGKTGTAQKPDLRNGGYLKDAYVASFMGFIPARSPRLAILVTVDEPQGDNYGGTVAAPVFKEIASQSLSYLGVFSAGQKAPAVRLPPIDSIGGYDRDYGDGGAPSPARARGDEERTTEWDSRYPSTPDFSGKTVRTVLSMARDRSINIEIVGSGKAVAQRPSSGRSIPANGQVVVWFQ